MQYTKRMIFYDNTVRSLNLSVTTDFITQHMHSVNGWQCFSSLDRLHSAIENRAVLQQPSLIVILSARHIYRQFYSDDSYQISQQTLVPGLQYIRLNGHVHLLFVKPSSKLYPRLAHIIQGYIAAFEETYLSDLAATLGKYLKARNFSIATAESCTGGLIVKSLTDIAGASHYVNGGVCTYTADAKENILCVPKETIETYGVVSSETALAMAKGAQALFQSNIALATTGVAGPGPDDDGNPEGLVWTAVAIGEQIDTYKYTAYKFSPLLDRDFIRRNCTAFILQCALESLKE